MSITTLTNVELTQDVGQARQAALQGPVFITDRGRPEHVLLSFQGSFDMGWIWPCLAMDL